MTLLDAIPADHRDAVAAALTQTFGDATVSLVDRLTGVSALGVFHLRVDRHGDVVLRLDPRQDVLRDPHRQAACIQIASDGAITPKHLHNDPTTGISIARYVAPHPTPWPTRLAEAASVIRRLHALPAFPAFAPYRQNMEIVRSHVVDANILGPDIAGDILDAFSRALDVYPWDDDLVASHNDLNPSNMVFDGERTWIVDWETAFAADRYVDIATLANWLTSDAAGEEQVLGGYFGGAPTDYQRARFHLMRQVNRFFYGGMLLITAAQPGFSIGQADWDANPGLDALRPQMNKLAVHAGRVEFGAAFLKDAVSAMAQPAYAAALATAAAA